MPNSKPRLLAVLAVAVAGYLGYWFVWPYCRMTYRLGVMNVMNMPASVCLTQPGYAPVDKSPVRSPLVIADHLIEHSRGKTIFEVGTRNGDILACVARFASKAYSAEINSKYCPVLRERGLTVLCDDFRKYDPSDLPGLAKGEIPDVFFWWPMLADKQNEPWMLHIRDALWKKNLGAGKRVIIAFDNNWFRDRENMQYMMTKYGDEMAVERHDVHYAESRHWRGSGTFSLLHFKLDPRDPHVT